MQYTVFLTRLQNVYLWYNFMGNQCMGKGLFWVPHLRISPLTHSFCSLTSGLASLLWTRIVLQQQVPLKLGAFCSFKLLKMTTRRGSETSNNSYLQAMAKSVAEAYTG